MLEQAGTDWNTGMDWNRLEYAGIDENWPEFAGKVWYRPIPAYSILFQPFQSIAIYSNQFQHIPQFPISSPQSLIWNAQLCILSPIGHLCVSSLIKSCKVPTK